MKYYQKIVFALILLLIPGNILMAAEAVSTASEPIIDPSTELIFLLDVSQSMEKTDRSHDVPDLIRQLDMSLPRNYQTGLVTYNEEVVERIGLNRAGGNLADNLNGITYESYTNAGAGLEQALSLFTANPDSVKKIIMISDGEIDMPTAEAKTAAVAAFERVLVKLTEQGITVDIVALGDLLTANQNNDQEQADILRAAESTGGEIYKIETMEGCASFAQSYLLEQCLVPAVMVGRISGSAAETSAEISAEASVETSAELAVELPDIFMDNARIYLIGGADEMAVDVAGRSERMELTQGKGFTIINLEKPRQQNFVLRISQPGATTRTASAGGSEIVAYLTAEYSLTLTAVNQYQPDEIPPSKGLSLVTEAADAPRSGTAYFDLDVINGAGDSLLSGHLREQKIMVWLDGEQQQLTAAGGRLRTSKIYTDSSEVQLSVVLPPSYASYHGTLAATDYVEVPPPPEPPQIDYFLVTLIVLLILSLAVILIWSQRRRRRYPGYLIKRSGNGNNGNNSNNGGAAAFGGDGSENGVKESGGFWGRITIYVLNSSDGIDYNPESVNLNTQCSKDTITLQWLLDKVNLPMMVKEADKIILRPGEGRSLLVKNTGRATALKGRDVLAKFHNYPVHFHEKVTFIFDNDLTGMLGGLAPEIEIHYNDLKVNEFFS